MAMSATRTVRANVCVCVSKGAHSFAQLLLLLLLAEQTNCRRELQAKEKMFALREKPSER